MHVSLLLISIFLLQGQVDSYERAVIAANSLIASLPNGTNDLRAMSRRLNRRVRKTSALSGKEVMNEI